MSTKRKTLHAAAALLLAVAAPGVARGAAAVNFSSAAGATNLRSDGAPMDSAFLFQIGAFSDGFAPTAANTDQWLTHWTPLSDAAGDPLPGATTAFGETALPSPPFAAGTVTAGFSGSVEFDHSQPPFNALGAVYIWGFDNRLTPGAGEWLLVTSSAWGWPAGTGNPPATTYSVGAADTVVLGAVNGDGFHMQSAAVTVSETSSLPRYDNWLAAHFTAAERADAALVDSLWGALADPDGDGIANVIEYFTAADPNTASPERQPRATSDGTDLLFVFYQAKNTQGATGAVEWSTDLVNWSADGVEIESTEDLGDAYLITARIPGAGAADTFARLNVRRDLE